MSNINDFVSKNKTFKGKSGIIPSDITGVTGDRVNEEGRLRYNNTTNLMEYYNGNDWKSIDSPPIITTVALPQLQETAQTNLMLHLTHKL